MEILINGRSIPSEEITDVYMGDGGRYFVTLYGESDVEIDADKADELIEAIPHVVDQSIIDQRKKAGEFTDWIKDG